MGEGWAGDPRRQRLLPWVFLFLGEGHTGGTVTSHKALNRFDEWGVLFILASTLCIHVMYPSLYGPFSWKWLENWDTTKLFLIWLWIPQLHVQKECIVFTKKLLIIHLLREGGVVLSHCLICIFVLWYFFIAFIAGRYFFVFLYEWWLKSTPLFFPFLPLQVQKHLTKQVI